MECSPTAAVAGRHPAPQQFFDHFEIKHDFESIGRRTMLLNARTLSGSSHPARIVLGIQDITEILQFQTAAQESQNRYQALIEASAQIVWTTDPAGGVVEDSPSWSAFTGQSDGQRKGFGWLDALHPEDRERVSELWQHAMAERTPVETEYRIRHNSGDWRWTAVRAVPVSNSDGSVHEWVGMNIDITGRKQGEEERARLAAIVESSDEPSSARTSMASSPVGTRAQNGCLATRLRKRRQTRDHSHSARANRRGTCHSRTHPPRRTHRSLRNSAPPQRRYIDRCILDGFPYRRQPGPGCGRFENRS